MTIVKQTEINSCLASFAGGRVPGIILIHGEPYFVKQAFDTLADSLQGSNPDKYGLEILEGGSISMAEIIEQTATFSFFSAQKIVAVKHAPLFQSNSAATDVGFSSSDLENLSLFIDRGIPENHFLVLMCEGIDKRKKIYKVIADKGLIIDCAVAQGVRKADQDEQRNVLSGVARHLLSAAGKTIEPPAFNLLADLTGFNLDLLSQNLSKLIAYIGTNKTISFTDVGAVVRKDKKDPIFNLTNAFMDKDLKKALMYLSSLLDEGYHPLQILKSLENLIRKLILVNDFILSHRGKKQIHFKQITFNAFKQGILTDIVEYDNRIKKEAADQDLYLSGEGKKNALSNDLLLAPNPKNAYPVFQLFQKSENFSSTTLHEALTFLSDLDYRLKSSSFDAKTAIENFMIKICSKGGGGYAEENKDHRHHF